MQAPRRCRLSSHWSNLLDDPTVGGFVVSAHDITARLAAELELRQTLSMLTRRSSPPPTVFSLSIIPAGFRASTVDLPKCGDCPSQFSRHATMPQPFSFVLDQLTSPEAFQAKIDYLYANLEAEISDTLEFQRRSGVRAILQATTPWTASPSGECGTSRRD